MQDLKNNLNIFIGKKIKTRRKELQISQEELSKKMGLSRPSLSNIEIGRHQVALYTLYELCDLLDLDIFDVIPNNKEVIKEGALQDDFVRIKNFLDESEYNHIFNSIKNI